MQRRTLLNALPMVAAMGLTSKWASAQSTIRIIVPFGAGGPIDTTVRVLAEAVKDTLGSVIIENRPGAGGNIGVAAAAKSAPDGLTLGIATTASHGINPWLFSTLPYDPARDFAPITQMLRVPNVLVMNADTAKRMGINSLADLIRYGRAYPGRLNFGSGGNGSAGHLAGELLKQRAGFFAVHIPYNGAAPAQNALLAGQVDFNIDNLAAAAGNIRAGRLKAFAVTSTERSPVMPEVPAVAESLPGFAIDTWWGLVAPAGTPAAVVTKLHGAFATALASPEVKARFAQLMAEPAPSSPTEFERFLSQERDKYQSLVKISRAKVD